MKKILLLLLAVASMTANASGEVWVKQSNGQFPSSTLEGSAQAYIDATPGLYENGYAIELTYFSHLGTSVAFWYVRISNEFGWGDNLFIMQCPVDYTIGADNASCDPPPPVCPDIIGETVLREYPVTLDTPPNTDYHSIVVNGCEADIQSVSSCWSFPDDPPNGYCVGVYEYTGEEATEGEPDTLPDTIYSGETQTTPDPPVTTTEQTAPVVTTDSGNTTVETITESTTVENAGPNITNEEETVTIEYSDGTTTETVTVTTVTTTPEGVTTTTTEQTITETISDTNVIEYSGGTGTGSTIPGGSSTGTTSTTSTVGSDGSSTSDSTCTGIGCTGGSSSGTEEGIEDAEYDGPKAGDPESWWESKYPDGINTVFTDFQSTHITGGPLGTWLGSWTLASSGTCPTWSVSTAGLPVSLGNIDLSIDCDIYTFIRAILLVTASFVAFRLIFGR